MSILRRRDLLKLGAGLSGAYLLESLAGCGSNGGTIPLEPGPHDAGAGSSPTPSPTSAPDGSVVEPPQPPAADAGTVLADPGPTLTTRIPSSIVKARRDELDLTLKVLSGRLPADIAGHVFMIAALPWGDGTNVVNGDGMVYRLDFGGSDVPMKCRLAKTACYYADHATTGTSRAFKNAGLVRWSQSLGVRNEANTAFVRMNDRLLITFDAGRPHEIDPTTLEIATPVGAMKEWKRSVPELFMGGPFALNMTGAHPFYDEHTGELFSVNFGMGGIPGSTAFTDVVRWDGKGALERWSVVLPGGGAAEIKESMHQIGVTQDYLVLMDCAFSISPLQLILPSAPSTAPSPDSVVYVVKRSDLKAGGGTVTAKKLTIPREAAHFTCDYENPNGKITLHFGHNDGADPAEWLRTDDVRADDGSKVRADLLGMLVTTTDVNAMGRYVIDGESGTLADSALVHDDDATWLPALYTHRGSMTPGRFEDIYWCTLGFSAELLTKRVLDLYRNYPYRKIPIASLPTAPKAGALFRLDVTAMKVADAYVVPGGRMLLSPQFVPKSGKSTGTRDGYLVCSVISDDTSWKGSSGDEFWIFDASNLAQGPICRLAHPDLDLGFTLHTTWMETITKRSATYQVKVRDDFADLIATQPQDVKDLFEKDVFPHFV